jgi:hypothetical protein
MATTQDLELTLDLDETKIWTYLELADFLGYKEPNKATRAIGSMIRCLSKTRPELSGRIVFSVI